MKSYVALLRGIGPANPNMRNDKLRGVFEGLGFGNVRTVISSGNVLFETDSSAVRAMESTIEEALPQRLGFASTTIIRSRAEIQALVAQDPFRGVDHSDKTNLNVTFLKRRPRTVRTFPYRPRDRAYTILGIYGRRSAASSISPAPRRRILWDGWRRSSGGKSRRGPSRRSSGSSGG